MIVRGFRAELAALAGAVRARESKTLQSHALILVADWLCYWSLPGTWPRVWPHLRAWLRVRAVWPVLGWCREFHREALADFRREALALKPRRWPT